MKNKYVKLGIYIGTIVFAIAFLLFFIPGTKKVYNERFKKYQEEIKKKIFD